MKPLSGIALALVLVLSLCPTGARADSTAFRHLGDVLAAALPAGAGVATLVMHDEQGTRQLVKAGLLTTAVTYALKYSIHAERPSGGLHSFPSGHTSVAFAAGGFVGLRYGWRYGLPLSALAGVVAWSRVESRQHYTRDVVAGGALGLASDFLLVHPRQGMMLSPEAAPGRVGVRFSAQW